ncbi:MAG TPA: APC family permease [Candidatus Sulfotelmatobacter sp.]|nr:APC family permease [Candidatus Sulfotelmatobacter sp.]
MSKEPKEPKFIAALGARDVALMVTISVIGLRWIPRGARAGAPSVLLWGAAGLLFFLPLALAVVELSTRYPEEGGLYVWVDRAWGPGHAFMCGWCIWLNQLFYFANYLLFAESNFLVFGGERGAILGNSRIFSALFVLCVLWILTVVNVMGFGVAKWLQNLGTIGIWVPMAILLAASVVAMVRTGSATSFQSSDFIPRGNPLSTLSLWSGMCFAFSGLEIAGFVGEEIRNPRRSLPRGIGVASLLITIIYIVGSASILVVMPASNLAERTGIADAVSVATHSRSMGLLSAILIAISVVATTGAWIAAAARVPFAAAVRGTLPQFLKKLHPRFHTPYLALLLQAAGSSVVLLVALFWTVGTSQSTVEEAYEVMLNVTILIYFVPYVYLFLAPLRLRGCLEPAAGFVPIPLGRIGRILVVAMGFVTTSVAIALLFVPPPGTQNVWSFEIKVIAQASVVFLVGLIAYGLRWWPPYSTVK